MERSTLDAAAIWLASLALYLLLVGSVSLNEVLAGLGCASLATLWWWSAGRRGTVRFRFGGALRPLGPALGRLPVCTLRVGLRLGAALRGPRTGSVAEHPATDLPWAGASGETAPAVRAVGVLSASLAPDGYVLHLDRAHGTVILHDIDAGRP